jgi:competence ComEA-like helix-hairpin-helix protein
MIDAHPPSIPTILSKVYLSSLLLIFRVASICFLISFPLLKFMWSFIGRPWIMGSLINGIGYIFSPLKYLNPRMSPARQLPYYPLLPAPEPPRLDLNKATVDELRRVEGVGHIKAMEIVHYRDQYGPFRRIEELGLVSGIGSFTIQQLSESYEVKP